MECPEKAHMAQGKKKIKNPNCDQMMWELEPSKLWVCACLEAFALQIPVLSDSVCVIMAVGTWSDHRRN